MYSFNVYSFSTDKFLDFTHYLYPFGGVLSFWVVYRIFVFCFFPLRSTTDSFPFGANPFVRSFDARFNGYLYHSIRNLHK